MPIRRPYWWGVRKRTKDGRQSVEQDVLRERQRMKPRGPLLWF